MVTIEIKLCNVLHQQQYTTTRATLYYVTDCYYVALVVVHIVVALAVVHIVVVHQEQLYNKNIMG